MAILEEYLVSHGTCPTQISLQNGVDAIAVVKGFNVVETIAKLAAIGTITLEV